MMYVAVQCVLWRWKRQSTLHLTSAIIVIPEFIFRRQHWQLDILDNLQI